MEDLEKIANKLSREIFLKEIGSNMSYFAIYTLGSAASFHNLKNKILDYVQKSSSKDYVVNHTLRKHENYLRYLRS